MAHRRRRRRGACGCRGAATHVGPRAELHLGRHRQHDRDAGLYPWHQLVGGLHRPTAASGLARPSRGLRLNRLVHRKCRPRLRAAGFMDVQRQCSILRVFRRCDCFQRRRSRRRYHQQRQCRTDHDRKQHQRRRFPRSCPRAGHGAAARQQHARAVRYQQLFRRHADFGRHRAGDKCEFSRHRHRDARQWRHVPAPVGPGGLYQQFRHQCRRRHCRRSRRPAQSPGCNRRRHGPGSIDADRFSRRRLRAAVGRQYLYRRHPGERHDGNRQQQQLGRHGRGHAQQCGLPGRRLEQPELCQQFHAHRRQHHRRQRHHADDRGQHHRCRRCRVFQQRRSSARRSPRDGGAARQQQLHRRHADLFLHDPAARRCHAYRIDHRHGGCRRSIECRKRRYVGDHDHLQ